MQGIPGNSRFLSTANVASAVCDDNIVKLLPDAGLPNHAKSANKRSCALEPARTEQTRSYIAQIAPLLFLCRVAGSYRSGLPHADTARAIC